MRRHLTNAWYGVIDYLSYPVGMLLVAPIVLHRIGAAEYGLWMIATSVVSAGSIVASGFGDACVQRVAQLRAIGEAHVAASAVRSILAINLLLGCLLGFASWLLAPYASSRIAATQSVTQSECVVVMRIASVLILVRAMESVPVGVQRAFEQYRTTVRISSSVRILTLASAAVLASLGMRCGSILSATAVVMVLGAAAQLHQARRLLNGAPLRPMFTSGETRLLLERGSFLWLQSIGGVIFGQLDRILLGTYLGALAVAPYSLCVQFTHPIYGLTGAALNFLFPYLSGRVAVESPRVLRQTVFKAFAVNALLVAFPSALLLIFGKRIIALWAGATVAESAAPILPTVVLASAFVGLSVTGIYAMQALGLFRTVAYVSLTGRAVTLFVMIGLLRHSGLAGLADARLCYGAVALMVYLPLLQQLGSRSHRVHRPAGALVACEIQEGSKL
jgi:O-antigen/teichoic acid export membrane protein